ncbi:hypothetical protein FGO68_gene14712 [Halteria grandinella]|uniref:Uncharacterized protein n=1 Tax=Halteria grandinella TaxID=5974 RepID=A0A8J8T426_HALGN|nr:hypothetical protein FGO68_gene14712 [Halteria grandinella]
MIAKKFGHVSIKMFLNSNYLHEHGKQVFALQNEIFKSSLLVSCHVDLNIKRENTNQKSIFSIAACIQTNKIHILTLGTSDLIFLNVDCINRIQNLKVLSNKDEGFKLVFENLDTPFPKTKFQIEIENPKLSQLESIYSNIPNYFDVQHCDIILNTDNFDSDIHSEIQQIKARFPKNKIITDVVIINESDQAVLEQTYNFLKGNPDTIQVSKYVEYAIKNQSGQNDQDTAFCLRNLSKFRISDIIEIFIDQSFILDEFEQKCECPMKMLLAIINIQDWATLLLQVFNRFCNYGNAKKLIIGRFGIKIQERKEELRDFFIKLSEFVNLNDLTLPLNVYDGVAEDIIEMLKKLQNLETLQFNNLEDNEYHQQVIQKVSHYIIENMGKLRVCEFIVKNTNNIEIISSNERANPLTITIGGYNQTQLIFDPRYGLKKLYNS